LAQQTVVIRAIVMKNKPAEMLSLSPKGTVPVLVVQHSEGHDSKSDVQVIDESLDIMLWALKINDPENLLYVQKPDILREMLAIIEKNDQQFVGHLSQYKRASRFHSDDEEEHRLLCEPFIQRLEFRLSQNDFLMGSTPSLLDYALLPFIRQFSRVNRSLYLQGPYTNLQGWLNRHLQSRLFSKAMFKYPLWLDEQQECFLGK